jgi:hypothetical protein
LAAEDGVQSGMGMVMRPWFEKKWKRFRVMWCVLVEIVDFADYVCLGGQQKQKSPHRCGLFSVS